MSRVLDRNSGWETLNWPSSGCFEGQDEQVTRILRVCSSHHGRKRQSGRSTTRTPAWRQFRKANLGVQGDRIASRRLFRGSWDDQECLNRLRERILRVCSSRHCGFRHFGWSFQLETVLRGVQIGVAVHTPVNMANGSTLTPKSS